MGKEDHPPSSLEHLHHKGNSEGRHDEDTTERATPSMGTSWLGMACVYAGELLPSKNCPWSMLIQKVLVGIAWGVLLDIGQNHVMDFSNTVTVCAVAPKYLGPCSGTVLFTSLYVTSNAEVQCSYVSHCGAVSELALTTPSHNTDRLERRGTGRKDERNIIKNGLNARTAHLDPVLLKANI